MKALRIIKGFFRALWFLLLGAILLLTAVGVMLYSPWVQDEILKVAKAKISCQPGVELQADKFRLSFPLNVSLEDVAFINKGDTMVAAQKLKVAVSPWKIFKKELTVNDLTLSGGAFRMGSGENGMKLVVAANELNFKPVNVDLDNMAFELESGLLAGASVNIALSADTVAPTNEAPTVTQLSILLGELKLHDFSYSMSMPETIDSLGAFIKDGEIKGGKIDLGAQEVLIKSFIGDGLDARYIGASIAEGETAAKVETVAAADAIPTKPWTVEIDTIGFSGSEALYTTRGVEPAPGLDFGYLAFDSLTIGVSKFYNQGPDLRLPINLKGNERCGVALDVKGVFEIDSTLMRVEGATVSTPYTKLDVDFNMGMGSLTGPAAQSIGCDIAGEVGVSDLKRMFPAFRPYLVTLPNDDSISIDAVVNGTTAKMDIAKLGVIVNKCVRLNAHGSVGGLNNDALKGKIFLNGDIINLNKIKNAVLDKQTAEEINIPRMNIEGVVALAGKTVNGDVTVKTGGGKLTLEGKWSSNAENYNADLNIEDFPVETFMPNLGLGQVTASLKAEGHGYDLFNENTNSAMRLDVKKARYLDYTYKEVHFDARLSGGRGYVNVFSPDPNADIKLTAWGNTAPQPCKWSFGINANSIDLLALGFSSDESKLSFDISGNAGFSPNSRDKDVSLMLERFQLVQTLKKITVSDIELRLATTDSMSTASVANGDLLAKFVSTGPLDTVIAGFGDAFAVLNRQIDEKVLNVEDFQRALPKFDFTLTSGKNNFINEVLASDKSGFKTLAFEASNDSTLQLGGSVIGIVSGETRIDTVAVELDQVGEFMALNAKVENRPGTFDSWAHVNLGGYIAHNEVGLRFVQHDIAGRKGFDIGMKTTVEDSVATMNIKPYDPTIGYQQWTVNDNNFVSYNLVTRHVDADLTMTGGKSRLAITTNHNDSIEGQEDLNILVDNIHLADWVSINPFAPPMKGDFNAKIKLREVGGNLNGQGDVEVVDFYYGKDRVASVKAEFDVTTNAHGQLYAKSNLFVDGEKTVTLSGVLNDSTTTSPYNLDFSMIHFPLEIANPFLPPKVAKLHGMLNGEMLISGDKENPKINGYIDFDSTSVMLYMTGTDYKFSEVRIPVVDNLVSFDRFAISGVNNNPLYIDGTVELGNLSSPDIDLTLKANNMQLVNTNRSRKGADVFGKAFIGLDSHVRGNLNLLFIDADLRILPPTNVTYVLSDAATTLSSQSVGDMVKFVNFTDTTAVMIADSLTTSSTAMILNATLTIDTGTTIGVNLSSDGKNRAQIESSGTLTYTMSPVSEGRMTGRLNINGGYVRYSPPLMSEKNFAFSNSSYIAFNGDVMNPTLNVRAVDMVKANVTQSGQNSRLIDFDVILSVTGTLERLDVAFDLTTDDDVTVANELQSMSADQRANQAMNMLLYGIYTGPGTKGDASISGNALYSFLESQINSWAANNIKGVDISFGINQYDQTVDGSTSQTTSYSYQVSKSLFNDRFKVVIGGNYSTDANADENFSQNLINDISFDYFLNKGHTMYVRIFRHTGYESILEGEITQTGVGFVYRKKLNRLVDMFKFLKYIRLPKKRDENK